MNLVDIIAVAGPTGLLSAVATQAFVGRRERKASRQQGHYLALRLANLLERFASDCHSFVKHIDVAFDANGDPSTFPTTLPAAPLYPEDDSGWRNLDSALAHRVLALTIDRNAAQTVVDADLLESGSRSAPFECSRLAAILGLQAWEIAVAIRTKYRLLEYRPQFPFHEALSKRVASNERNRREAVERMKELMSRQSSAQRGAGMSADPQLSGPA